MLTGLFGKKIGMTSVYTDGGIRTPVTILECGPCSVIQIKTTESDGYNAVQLGFADGKKNRATKPMLGVFKKASLTTSKRFIREIRLPDGPEGEKIASGLKPGDLVKVDIFEGVWKVIVSGITKGRGFTGMVKKWNKKRGPESHGSMNVRAPGSSATSSRLTHINPGKHMPGHYGTDRCTVRNLEVVKIDKPRHLLFVKGAVPGAVGGLVEVRKTNLVKPAPRIPTKQKKADFHPARAKRK